MTPDGKPRDGAVSLPDFFQLMRKLGLAKNFALGFGKEFVETNRSKLADGIFLQTTHHPDGAHGGYHFLRLENTGLDKIVIVEPSRSVPASYITPSWDYLEKRGCVVIVCIP